MYNKFDILGKDVNIAEGGSDSSLIWDFRNTKNVRLGILIVYSSVSATTGCSLMLVPGTGNGTKSAPIGPLPSPAPWKRFATPDSNIVDTPFLAAPVQISDVNDPLNGKFVSFTELTIDELEVPRFMNLQFTNLDASNAATVSVFADT